MTLISAALTWTRSITRAARKLARKATMTARTSTLRKIGTRLAFIIRKTMAEATLAAVMTQIRIMKPRWDSERLGLISASM